jgi:FkbM family methyltransferase
MATAAQRQARDFKARVPSLAVRTIFDVGANVGETVRGHHEAYPDARIWAFEPVSASYARLQEVAADLACVRTYRLALAGRDGSSRVASDGTSDQNRLVDAGYGGATERVEVVMGDTFCAAQSTEEINYLKVDTEGFDLEVLRGFHRMLGEAAIDALCVEAGMNATNTSHVALSRFQGYLEPLGYHIFKLYNQSSERRRGPHLRRADVIFISPRLIRAHVKS